MKFKHVKLTEFEVKFAGDSATIEGYGSTFGNQDHDGDIVMPGAFVDSLKERMPAMLYQHKSDKIPGIWENAAEDSKGLMLQGKTLNTSLGRDVAEEMRSGALKSLSIGYGVKKDGAIYDRANNTRILKSLSLYEVSPVTFPANEQATITNVKAALEDIDTAAELIGQATAMCQSFLDGASPSPEMLAGMMQMMVSAMNLLEEPEMDEGESKDHTPKTIERSLREAGLTRSQARGLIAKGYSAIAPQREAEGRELEEICNLFNQFKL
jgi:uncharacterized protein